MLSRHAAIAAGFALAAMIAMLAPFGGGSFNPARSLGPGMLASNPDIRGLTWIYVVSPLSAAVCLGLTSRWLVPIHPDFLQIECAKAAGDLAEQGKLVATSVTTTPLVKVQEEQLKQA